MTQQAAAFDPRLPEFIADPYSFYRRYRGRGPVEINGDWNLFAYADCAAVLKDVRFAADWRRVAPPDAEPATATEPTPTEPAQPAAGRGPADAYAALADAWLLSRDPPDHTRLRALVTKAFTPRMIQRLRPRIQAFADELLDAAHAEGGSVDLIATYAFPLPVTVIAELLGVPAADHESFRAWSRPIAQAIDLVQDEDTFTQAGRATMELAAYLRGIIAERRKRPMDDLISSMLAAEEADARLSDNELLAMCILILIAGHETTVNLIGNGTLALLRHPEQLAALRAQPDLIESAVEELLRYDSPVQQTARVATEDLDVGGRRIERGRWVRIWLGAANRDPAVFADPDRLDLTRAPRHLSFGQGIHFCLGSALARTEGQIAINTLFRRAPNLALATDEPQWRPAITLRGLKALPVTL